MVRRTSRIGFFWVCRSCRGRAIAVEVLRKVVPKPVIYNLWQTARSGKHGGDRPCPSCLRPMTEIPLVADGLSEQIDVCTGCHLIWFDRGEFEALPRTASRKPTRRKLTDEQIDALALARVGGAAGLLRDSHRIQSHAAAKQAGRHVASGRCHRGGKCRRVSRPAFCG
ncbi:MAG: TFIIB-type zinc ribbon-containing protein [Planctomycetota bacterium]